MIPSALQMLRAMNQDKRFIRIEMPHPADHKTMLGINFAADDALFGTTAVVVAEFDPLEPPASCEGALTFHANWIELTPGGIRMELETGIMRYRPEHWNAAWSAIRGGNRILRGEEVTDERLKLLIGFRPPGYQGGRGRGKKDQAAVDYLMNAVTGSMVLGESEGEPVSVRTAVDMVLDGYRSGLADFGCPELLPRDRKLPWSESWPSPHDSKAKERLRQRVNRDHRKAEKAA